MNAYTFRDLYVGLTETFTFHVTETAQNLFCTAGGGHQSTPYRY